MMPAPRDRLPDRPRIAFLASQADGAQAALAAMERAHGQSDPAEADVLVALGGDGFMLQTLHRHGALAKPVYGMKLGTFGFLMNHYRDDGRLLERLHAAEPAVLKPLEMLAQTESGASTGSLAYNESAGGPVLPLGSSVVALTPIAAFRPRRWRGALLKSGTEVRFRVLDPYKRPVSATADSHEVRDVVEVTIREAVDRTVTLLFDPEHNLEERILAEQFLA